MLVLHTVWYWMIYNRLSKNLELSIFFSQLEAGTGIYSNITVLVPVVAK
jgi:hypothetical protein